MKFNTAKQKIKIKVLMLSIEEEFLLSFFLLNTQYLIIIGTFCVVWRAIGLINNPCHYSFILKVGNSVKAGKSLEGLYIQ
jgi:hypothetical protein